MDREGIERRRDNDCNVSPIVLNLLQGYKY